MVSRGFKKILCGVLLWTAVSFSRVLVDRVVVSVNSEPILESDVKMAMLFYGAPRKEVIAKLVENMLLYQFLLGKGLKVDEELINQALENIAIANKTNLEDLSKELSKENLTLEDLRRFLEKEIIATTGLAAFLEREVKVSDVEVELERLKAGEVKKVRDIELLVVDKKDKEKLREIFDPKKELDEMAKEMGLKVERLRVERGELVESLDKEIWQVGIGEIAIAEDEEHVYIAKVRSQEDVYEGRSLEDIKQEILLKKISQRRQELLERLRKSSFIKIIQ